MSEFDRLPPELRLWLAQAALPWSPRSAARAWRKALRESYGDTRRAHTRLDFLEQARLRADTRAIWGDDYPHAS
ncbi:hypothetical protein ERN12_01640 [Rhodobacteraceae bacterium]|nr:hypothetical protein ERN12_01640 [Paracoccaceae bacterium]